MNRGNGNRILAIVVIVFALLAVNGCGDSSICSHLNSSPCADTTSLLCGCFELREHTGGEAGGIFPDSDAAILIKPDSIAEFHNRLPKGDLVVYDSGELRLTLAPSSRNASNYIGPRTFFFRDSLNTWHLHFEGRDNLWLRWEGVDANEYLYVRCK